MMRLFKDHNTRSQLLRFAGVGIVSTAIDIALLNLGYELLHLPLILANIIAVSVATLFNYTAHTRWTFRPSEEEEIKTHFVAYLLVTLSSLYIVQTGILFLLTHVWSAPVDVVVHLLERIGILAQASGVARLNVAKLYALTVAAIWNFVLYRKFVFIHKKRPLDNE